MNDKELKPCPFCGNRAVITHDPLFGSDSEERFWRVVCVNNDCSMGNPDALHSNKKGLIDEWNTQSQQQEINRLKNVLSMVRFAVNALNHTPSEYLTDRINNLVASIESDISKPQEGEKNER